MLGLVKLTKLAWQLKLFEFSSLIWICEAPWEESCIWVWGSSSLSWCNERMYRSQLRIRNAYGNTRSSVLNLTYRRHSWQLHWIFCRLFFFPKVSPPFLSNLHTAELVLSLSTKQRLYRRLDPSGAILAQINCSCQQNTSFSRNDEVQLSDEVSWQYAVS